MKIIVLVILSWVLVYTMWGDEAEDKVFEEYKKLNNLV